MDPKIHIMEAPVFFLQCHFNFLKLIITSKPTIRNRAPVVDTSRFKASDQQQTAGHNDPTIQEKTI